MIDVQAVNPFALPCVDLCNKRKLPKCSGIYFVFDENQTILYIGMTGNFCERWNGHHRYEEIQNFVGVKIAWLKIDDLDSLRLVERLFIQAFSPLLCVICKPLIRATDPGYVPMKVERRVKVGVPNLGDRIKEARKSNERSITALAAASGITRAHWYNIEKGEVEVLPEGTLRNIENALGVDFGVTF